SFFPVPTPGFAALVQRWPMTNLLDILKETELRVGLTEAFRTTGAREVLSPEVLQRRLLLCLYEIISNLTPGGRSSIEMVIHRQTAIDAKCGKAMLFCFLSQWL